MVIAVYPKFATAYIHIQMLDMGSTSKIIPRRERGQHLIYTGGHSKHIAKPTCLFAPQAKIWRNMKKIPTPKMKISAQQKGAVRQVTAGRIWLRWPAF